MLEDLEALLEAKSPYYLLFWHAHLDLFWHPLRPDAPREKEKCHNWHEGKNVQKWPKIMFPEWISLRDVQVAGPGRAGSHCDWQLNTNARASRVQLYIIL